MRYQHLAPEHMRAVMEVLDHPLTPGQPTVGARPQ